MKFNELNLTPDLMRGIEDADFTDCTPVQEQTFKLVLDGGRDATVQSQTGTGKTAAFLISIFEILERDSRDGGHRHAALIVVPTRELAVQVADEAKMLGKHLSYRIGSVFGGVGYGQQERLLENGPDIIIGTPGRLLDFASSRKLDFKGFDILVLDEADRMLDMGFLPDVRKILRALPPADERKTLLFSATLSTRVKHLAWEHMRNPGEIEVAPEHVTVDEITQELYHVTRAEKLRLLLGLLEREQPDNALIFTNMKSTAVELAKRLSRNGLPSEYIMGDLPQSKRLDLINGIKEGRVKLLVATDVAARGLHIDDLDLVVNYDVPEDYELYVHRIGRTARAGKTGKAITLACERYVYGLEAIESFIGQKIPVVWPDESLFKDDASTGMSFSQRSGGGFSRRGERTGGSRQRSGRSRGPGDSANHSRQRSDGGSSRRSGSRAPAGGGAKAGRRDDEQHTSERAATAGAKPPSDASLEDRLSYYRQKYGEDFQINSVKSDAAGTKRGGPSGSTEPSRQPGRGGQNGRGGQSSRGDQPGRGSQPARGGRGGQPNRGGQANHSGQGGRRGQSGRTGRSNRGGQENLNGNRGPQRSAAAQNGSAGKNQPPRTSGGEPPRNGQRNARPPQQNRMSPGKGGSQAAPPSKPSGSGAQQGAPANDGLVAKLKRLFKRQ